MELDDRKAVPGQSIFIPGHPKGWAKQFVIDDSFETSGSTNGRCAVLDLGQDTCGYSRRYESIQYTCDTLGGSSGSPVIAVDTGKVIGLHHCGALQNSNCRLGNLAVPMEGPGILADIQEFLEEEAAVPDTLAPSLEPTNISSLPPTTMPSTMPTTSPPPTTMPSTMPTMSLPTTSMPTVEVTQRCFAPKMRLEIQLDDFAAETRWELWQSDPPRMISGGGGGGVNSYENNALIEEEYCLADDGVHYLRFYDDFGDGFCCGKGNGYYKVYYQNFLIHYETGEVGNYTEVEISPSQVCFKTLIHLTIQTDRYGIETTWELLDHTGAEIAKGGPYPKRFQLVEQAICAPNTGKDFTLTVRDSFSDGLCCGSGHGSFSLSRNGDVKLRNNGVFKKYVTYNIPAIGPGILVDQG